MNRYYSSIANEIIPYVPGEQPQDRRYIKLNTNENPYQPAPKAAMAAAAAVERLRLYPDPESVTLREEIARHLSVKPENVFVGNGSDEVLALAFIAFFDPAVGVLAPEITYTFYPVYAQLFGIPYHTVPMNPDFTVPLDLLDRDMPVAIANPNAPTSLDAGREPLMKLARSLQAKGHVLLLDEAYSDFGLTMLDDCVNELDNLLITHTMSKSHSLAGMRVGYAIAHPLLIDALNRIKNSFNSYTLDALAQAVAVEALRDEDYFHKNLSAIIATRDVFIASIRALGFVCPDSSTNFVFAKHPGFAGQYLFDELKKRGVLVRHFNKPVIADYMRITIGTPEEMEQVVVALREAIGE